MPRYNIDNPLTDDGRNKMNSMFEELYNQYISSGLNAVKARELAAKAVAEAGKAIAEAEKANSTADRVSAELGQAILQGDSSPLEGQLSVGGDGVIYPSAQQRFVDERQEIISELSEIKKTNILEAQSKAQAYSSSNVFHFPKLIRSSNNPLIEKTFAPTNQIEGASYNLKFTAILPAYRYLINPIDKYYLYACSHDSDGVWLFTAPTPEGPFTIYSETPILTTSSFLWATDHVSSPDVLYDEVNKKILLYTHSPVKNTNAQQFTGLSTSDDGINFTPYSDEPILKSNGHPSRWNGRSVSYVRILKVGNEYCGVYQANSDLNAIQFNTRTTSIGTCFSKDGYEWELAEEPLVLNPPNNIGFGSPTVFHWNGFYLIIVKDAEGFRGFITPDLRTDVRDIGIIFANGTSYDNSSLFSPNFFYENGVLYMYYGFTGTSEGIAVAKAEVNFNE